jgi:hypothetical protein
MKPNRIILLLAIVILILACNTILPTDEPPGVGDKAEHGYSVSNQIINALEQFRIETGEYPESLEELVPNYLSAIPTEVNDQPITYQKTEESFSLIFRYIGPGMNTCTYTPEEKWQCSGAY